MKIVRLQAENVKRLVAVDITPKSAMVIIGGENEQGKSSVLDSIEMAFGGKAVQPKRPIRKGQEKGTIVAETEDFVLTRVMREDGKDTLTIRSREGGRYGQTTADGWVSSLTFDPLEFTRMEKGAQLRTLKRLVGLDFSDLDAKKASLYDKRKIVNAEGVRLKGQYEGTKHHPDAPEDLIVVADLMSILEERKKVNEKNESLRRSQTSCLGQQEILRREIHEIEVEMEILQNKKLKKQDRLTSLIEDSRKLEERIDAAIDANEEEIRVQIKEAEGINAKVRENRTRKGIEERLSAKRLESQALTDEIAAIDAAKRDAVASAKFPIEGLSLTNDDIEYKGIPFDQCSDAQTLRVSTAMGFALNPKLKVILIRNGSMLDDKNLAMIAKIAEENDGQIWVERVGTKDDGAIVIEDGSVAKN